MNIKPLAILLAALSLSAHGAEPFDDKFRQLEELLPTPGVTRTASGAPGHAYWQQRADYVLRATLDENKRAISGAGTVTYHNNSPDTLSYLWVQLDQNMFRSDSDNRLSATVPSRDAWAKATAADGMQALKICEHTAFDLIFMDVRMPELDGRETTRRIRAGAGPNAAVPIIAVTADTSADDIAACTGAGMTYFVPKPITPPMLLGAITHVMTMAQAGDADAETAAA